MSQINFGFCLILVLALSGASAHGSFIKLDVKRQNGQFCYFPFGSFNRAAETVCLKLLPIKPFEISVVGSVKKFEKLTVEEFAISKEADQQVEFEATVSWKGTGAGTLGISGLEGKLLIFGKILKNPRDLKNKSQPYSLEFENFADESLFEELSRRTVLGTDDSLKAEYLTEQWLRQVVVPGLEKFLNSRALNDAELFSNPSFPEQISISPK